MERWTWSHSLRNLGAKFSEMSFPHCKIDFTLIGHYLKTTIFKPLDSNYFTLSSMFCFLLFFKWLQVVRSVASGGIFYRLPSYKENTAY